MTLPRLSNSEAARSEYYGRLGKAGLAPLWTVLGKLVTPSPTSPVVPASWSFSDIRPLLLEAGHLISAEEAERRVLILENPGMPGESRISRTLYAGLQLILPGEIAPAHRHTQNALRFVMEGEGAFTALDGDRVYMSPYDLVLTPGWRWHDHGNETQRPMIWLDGLDIPLIQSLDASFAEHRPDRGAWPSGTMADAVTGPWRRNLKPSRFIANATPSNPLAVYRFGEWDAALNALTLAQPPHPHDAHCLEFANPMDGGSVMNTMAAFARAVPAGFETRSLQSSDSQVHVIVKGKGSIEIDGQSRPLEEGDILVVPPWSVRRLQATSRLLIFSYSDKPVQTKLGLWRERLH